MKRASALCLALPLLLCLTPTTARAQQATPPAAAAHGPFDDVPAASWIYYAVKTLQDAKIVIGYPMNGTYSGRRPMTRYEFASGIARLLPLVTPPAKDIAPSDDLIKLRQELRGELTQNPLALNAFIALVDEFQRETQKLGVDVGAAQARLEEWQAQVRRDVAAGKVSMTPEMARSLFADVPTGDPAYADARTLLRAKIIIGYLVGTYTIPPVSTRLQFASEIARILDGVRTADAPAEDEMLPSRFSLAADTPAELGTFRLDVQGRLRQYPLAIPALSALAEEFAPELKRLGQDVPAAQARLAALSPLPISPPFPDVPKDHWAYQAVETLRKAGIVTGEADGRFHG